MVRVRFTVDNTGHFDVELRTPASPSVKALLSALPFSTRAHRWGEEVYFEVPFHVDLESNARQDFDVGEVGFWPDGDAIAIFFGRTPASTDDRPRAYSPCNPVGRVVGDLSTLSSVREGSPVRAARA